MESRQLRLRDRPNLPGRTGSRRWLHRALPCRPVHRESGRWHRRVLRSRCLRTGCRQRGHTEAEEQVAGLHPQSAKRRWQLPQRPRTVGTLSSSALRSRKPTTTNVGCRNPLPTEPRAGAQPEVAFTERAGQERLCTPSQEHRRHRHRRVWPGPTGHQGHRPRRHRWIRPSRRVRPEPRHPHPRDRPPVHTACHQG
jgi:hypothetical protein